MAAASHSIKNQDDGSVVVSISLPNHPSAANLSAEIINGSTFVLTDDEVKGVNEPIFQLQLPCKVDDEACSISFSKRTRTLTVTLQALSPTTLSTATFVEQPGTDARQHLESGTCASTVSTSCADMQALNLHEDRKANSVPNACAPDSGEQRSSTPLHTAHAHGQQDAAANVHEPASAAPASAPGTSTSVSQQTTASIAPAAQSEAACCQAPAGTAPSKGLTTPAATPSSQAPASGAQQSSARTNNSSNSSSTSTTSGSSSGANVGGSSSAAADGGVAEAPSLDCSNLAIMLSSASMKQHTGSSKKSAKAERKKVNAMLDDIAHRLATQGFCVCDGYVPTELVIDVRKEVKQMEGYYEQGEIWVGKEADIGATITRRDVRGDKVLWMPEESLTATSYQKDGQLHKCCFRTLHTVLRSIDRLVMDELPSRAPSLEHVTSRSDAMMAIYPGEGARFAKHIDNTADDGRRLTLLCYLNPNWKNANGGALRLFPPGAAPVDVYPQGGRLAMFMSKTVAHEVMPTRVPRHSFTLWYYDALEKAEAAASARIAAGGGGAASIAAQQEARDLVRDLLAGTALQATDEGVARLVARVGSMSSSATAIVASVVGAPSPDAFVEAVRRMTPDGLSHLRDELARMGLADSGSVSHTPQV